MHKGSSSWALQCMMDPYVKNLNRFDVKVILKSILLLLFLSVIIIFQVKEDVKFRLSCCENIFGNFEDFVVHKFYNHNIELLACGLCWSLKETETDLKSHYRKFYFARFWKRLELDKHSTVDVKDAVDAGEAANSTITREDDAGAGADSTSILEEDALEGTDSASLPEDNNWNEAVSVFIIYKYSSQIAKNLLPYSSHTFGPN